MIFDLDVAPGGLNVSLGVDEEGAAFDAHIFFAVEAFQFDDIKKLTHDFFGVTDEIKGQAEAGTGVVMAFQAVS